MPVSVFEFATDVRLTTCSLCSGGGDVQTDTSSYSELAAQWFPAMDLSPCPCCKGVGEKLETFCLVCQEQVDGCGCTNADIEQFILSVYLGAA